MSTTTIPVPSPLDLKKISGSDKYDFEDLRYYFAYTRKYGNDLQYKGRITNQFLKENADNAGFNSWLNDNFVKNPSWLKGVWSNDSQYRLKKSSDQGSYIEFDASELLSGGPFLDAYYVEGNDIVYGYKKHSLKTELSSTGKDGLKGNLVKMSNGKWRVYLNGSSTSLNSTGNTATSPSLSNTGNAASTTSAASNSGTSSSNTTTSGEDTVKLASNLLSDRFKSTSGTGSTSSTSSTTTGSTTGISSTTSTDSTSNRSFDFLDNVLGTQKKEDSKDKTTELDPNQVANTIVSDTKLNDTAISSLVSTYLNSLYRINRSYNTQTK